jgi:hypothetical protein
VLLTTEAGGRADFLALPGEEIVIYVENDGAVSVKRQKQT